MKYAAEHARVKCTTIFRASALVIAAVVSVPTSAGSIVINSSSGGLVIGADDGDNGNSSSGGNSVVISSSELGLPYAQSVTVEDGNVSTFADIDLTSSELNISLAFETGSNGGSVAFNGSALRITALNDTLYNASSEMNHSGGTFGTYGAQLFLQLRHLASATNLYQSDQQMLGTNSSFRMESDGDPGGSNINSITGSSSGLLQAGETYRLTFISGSSNMNPFQFATSEINISFTAVSETSSWALMLAGMVMLRRRKRVIPTGQRALRI